MSEEIIAVRRHWNDYRIARYRIGDVSGLHWDNESGGTHARAPQMFLHGYVMCDAMLDGELAHSCSHGPPPHRIKVCITKKGNEKIWPALSAAESKSAASARTPPASRASVEALGRSLRAIMEEEAARKKRKAERLERKTSRIAQADAAPIGIPDDDSSVAHQRRVAAHEAGHAVAARPLAIPAYEVTIVAREDFLGGASFDNPVHDWKRGDGAKATAADRFVIVALAGREAETLLLGTGLVNDSDDLQKSEDCLAWAGAVRGAAFVGDERFDRHIARLRRRAAALVRQNRPAIETVAAALLSKQSLTGPEVDAILAAGA